MRTVESRCATVMRVQRSLSRPAITRFSVELSSALVASSSSISVGLRSTARAIATRWRWPPDSEPPPSETTVSYAHRHLGDVVVQARDLRGVLMRSSVAPGDGERDVLAQRAAEDERVLRHDADLLAHARRSISWSGLPS